MIYKELLDSSNEIQNDKSLDCVNIAVISNISFDPYFTPLLTKQFSENNNLRAEVFPIPYEEYDLPEHEKSFEKTDLIVIWLNFDSLFPSSKNDKQHAIEDITALLKRLLNNISQYSNAKILMVLFEDHYEKLSVAVGHNYVHKYFIDRLNINLTDTLSDNASFIDLKSLIAEIGISKAYDLKSKYRWNAPYSKALVEAVVKEIHKQFLIEKGITKKCLVLDCDNVLWGGILSEEGIENIKLGGSGFGRSYQDFQRFALSLYYHGVILTVCSKNDLPDVMTMFCEHSEMILKEEHIACFQVNWENKPENLTRIAETLNIGLDSVVFVDDSPIEVEAIKSMLPEVTAILYERDSVYDRLSCFNLKSNVRIEDIEKRNETYRTNQFRERLKSQYDNYDEYIASLEIKMDIHEALPIEYSRIAELTQRTNKCTNGKRYTVTEIKDRVVRESVKLYSLSVADRFSDLGLVGVLEVEGDMLTLFCLSCRALGREIEGKLLEFIVGQHQLHKITFESTGKNEDIKPIFARALPNAAFMNCENG